jgi:hypothetical protein
VVDDFAHRSFNPLWVGWSARTNRSDTSVFALAEVTPMSSNDEKQTTDRER